MRDSMDKIRLKCGPKDYKTAPGLAGRERVERSVRRLILQAVRLTRKATTPEDVAWAQELVRTLQRVLGVS